MIASPWCRWYAWYPVRVDGRWRWRIEVEYRYYLAEPTGYSCWDTEYRLIRPGGFAARRQERLLDRLP